MCCLRPNKTQTSLSRNKQLVSCHLVYGSCHRWVAAAFGHAHRQPISTTRRCETRRHWTTRVAAPSRDNVLDLIDADQIRDELSHKKEVFYFNKQQRFRITGKNLLQTIYCIIIIYCCPAANPLNSICNSYNSARIRSVFFCIMKVHSN